jgi:hypothetical protein
MVGRPAAGLGLDWGWTMGKTDVLFIQARDTQKGKNPGQREKKWAMRGSYIISKKEAILHTHTVCVCV